MNEEAEAIKRRPSIHILRTEEELREAVERAAEFDKRTADALRSRSQAYDALVRQSEEAEATAPSPRA